MDFRKTLGGLAVLFVLLAACSGATPAPQETPAATVRPTHIPTNTIHYSTPLPTLARRPRQTPDPTALPGATNTPLSNSLGFAAFSFTPRIDPCEGDYSRSESPTGDWSGCQNRGGLVFTSASGQGWRVESPGTATSWLPIVHWTGDDRFVSFADQLLVDGGNGFHFSRWHGLFRLDLVSGNISGVLAPPPGEYSGFDFSFSPTGDGLPISCFGKIHSSFTYKT